MYLVSACLAGFKCRYDGSNCTNKVVQDLVNKGEAIPICPEQLAGLSTPREPCEIKTDEKGNKRIIGKSGRDYTKEYVKGAELTLTICKERGLNEALLKFKSPSCGCGLIYDGTFSGRAVKGNGLTAELLMQNGVRVKSESDI